jgi:hypothetical protein
VLVAVGAHGLRTEVALSAPGEIEVTTPVIVVDPDCVMRYGAVVVVGLELVPVHATYRGLALVLHAAGMNETTLGLWRLSSHFLILLFE